MRKTTLAILAVTVAMFFAVSAFACDGSGSAKTSSTSATSGCGTAEKAACAASGKTCPGMSKSTTTTASATLPNGHPQMTITEARACEGATTAFLSVDKMTCGSCVTAVTKTLGSMDGVCAVNVSLDKSAAVVVYHADQVDPDKMAAAVTKAGYTSAMMDMSKLDKTQVMQLCSELCGEKCDGKCVDHCANYQTCPAKAKTAEI